MTARVLNWGCGHQWSTAPAAWVCSDVIDFGQHHVGDVRDGLAFPAGDFDAVVHHHALCALDWPRLRPALGELARVTRPGGWMRFTVPDLVGAFDALGRDDRAWFPVGVDDEATTAGAFCAWATWFGTNHSVFTRAWLETLLAETGWDRPVIANGDAAWGVSLSPWPELAALDDRQGESLLVECRRATP